MRESQMPCERYAMTYGNEQLKRSQIVGNGEYILWWVAAAIATEASISTK